MIHLHSYILTRVPQAPLPWDIQDPASGTPAVGKAKALPQTPLPWGKPRPCLRHPCREESQGPASDTPAVGKPRPRGKAHALPQTHRNSIRGLTAIVANVTFNLPTT